VTGVQTCALPISARPFWGVGDNEFAMLLKAISSSSNPTVPPSTSPPPPPPPPPLPPRTPSPPKPVDVFHISRNDAGDFEFIQMPEVQGGMVPSLVPIRPAVRTMPINNPPPPKMRVFTRIPPDISSEHMTQGRLQANFMLPHSLQENRIELKDVIQHDLMPDIFRKCFGDYGNDDYIKMHSIIKKRLSRTGVNKTITIDNPNDPSGKIVYNVGTHLYRNYLDRSFYKKVEDDAHYKDIETRFIPDMLPRIYILEGNPQDSIDTKKRLGDPSFLQSVPQFEKFLFQIPLNFNSLYQENTKDTSNMVNMDSYFNRHIGARAAGCALGSLLYRQFMWRDVGSPDASPISDDYLSNPGIMIYTPDCCAEDAVDVYIGMKLKKNGFLDSKTLTFTNSVINSSKDVLQKIMMTSIGFSIVGIVECSNVIYDDIENNKIYLLGKNETKINQAICATLDFGKLPNKKERDLLHATSIFASYYNTLCFACDYPCRGIVLVPMGMGEESDSIRFQAGFSAIIFIIALKFATEAYPWLRSLPILFAVHDINDAHIMEFINEIYAHARCEPISDFNDIEHMTIP
jgi:hypothetical protein